MTDSHPIVRILRKAAPVMSAVAPGPSARLLEQLFITPRRFVAPSREQAWVADATLEQVRFDAQRSMPLYTWGEGPTVMLVHGWAGRGSQMAVFAAPLRKAGFRVVAFDAPAHGSADGRRTALPELALAVERVAEHVGPLHAIIGHSLGAAAATMALHRGLSVQRVAYVAPPQTPSRYLDRTAAMLGFSEAVARRTQARLEARFGLRFEQANAARLAPDLHVPLLAVHDEEDAEVPYEEGRRLVALWPGAQLVTVQGLGHRRILRDEGVVRTIVDFVAAGRESRGRAAASIEPAA